jgi:hypothetical protein
MEMQIVIYEDVFVAKAFRWAEALRLNVLSHK